MGNERTLFPPYTAARPLNSLVDGTSSLDWAVVIEAWATLLQKLALASISPRGQSRS